MLPFLKPRNQQSAGVSTEYFKTKPESDEDKKEDVEGLMAAAADFIQGIQTGDKKLVASALRSAFEILDAAPHEEGPHTNDESEQE